LRKIDGPDVQGLRLVPFDLAIVFAMGRGTPHGRHVNISIIVLS
jgi:hypothetical protein